MADPVTLGVTMAATAAGGIIGGIGAKQSADAQAAAYRYKAGVAQLNKQIADQNASWASQAGETQAEVSGMKSRQQIAQTKVAQAASGFDVNTGTSARVREDQSNIASFDQNVIRWDAAKTAYGYETQGVMDTAEANLDQMAASQQEKAGQLAMMGSFINTAGAVSGKWLQGQSTGMWSGFTNNNFGNSIFGGGSPSGYGTG